MKRANIVVPFILAAIVWAIPAAGQDAPPPSSGEVARELAGIQRSLGELVDLLATMRTNQEAELLLRRIELHERRLAPLERQLESNKDDQVNTRSSITDATEWRDRTEDEIRNLDREGVDDDTDGLRQQVVIANAEIERLNRRLESLKERQIDLEDRLADGRDEVDILDDLLRELLD
jgi:chromosome segregation ATPase